MQYDIPQAICEAASRCPYNLACLNGDGRPACPVERFISEKYLFVKSDGIRPCPYRIRFGLMSYVCGCPVRNALYTDYEI
ncbi:MAG: hypothetical protein JW951_08020 [Lentisphaerae bacterium]|nr:hypothetical protein [Lentisphaerota bacterium]